MEYYINSGKITNYSQGISVNNRAFRYGDALFETMYYTNGRVIFFDKHIERLRKGLSTFKIHYNNLIINKLLSLIKELIQVNNIKGSARIRLQVFRKDGGLYLPNNNELDYIIEVFPLDNSIYKINKKGIHIGIANSVRKDNNQFSQLKTTSKMDMVLCAIEAEEMGWDDAIIMNSTGKLVESSKSNLFIYKNNKLYTPTIEDGPLNGIMRQAIIELSNKSGIECIETHITETNLINADEVFLTNAIIGVNWVSAFKSKRYMHKISDILINELNKLL